LSCIHRAHRRYDDENGHKKQKRERETPLEKLKDFSHFIKPHDGRD